MSLEDVMVATFRNVWNARPQVCASAARENKEIKAAGADLVPLKGRQRSADAHP